MKIAEIFFGGIWFQVKWLEQRFPFPAIGGKNSVRLAIIFQHFLPVENYLVLESKQWDAVFQQKFTNLVITFGGIGFIIVIGKNFFNSILFQ